MPERDPARPEQALPALLMARWLGAAVDATALAAIAAHTGMPAAALAALVADHPPLAAAPSEATV